MNTRHIVFGALVCLLLYTPALSAQTAASPSAQDGWQFQIVPYLWGSSLDGGVGIGQRTADVDASFNDILDHLHFAAMGLVEAQRNQLVLLNDTFYADVRGQHATPGPLFSGVRPEQKLFILTPEAGYRIFSGDGASLDAVGGIRLWHLNSRLEFQPQVLPGIDLQASRNWVDAIVGLRALRDLPHNWWVRAYGDLGGGGSKFTYQIAGTAGVDLHQRYALNFGYRYLSVDYDKDNFLFDTAMKGPLFGFTIKF
jgi:hypothetical protein